MKKCDCGICNVDFSNDNGYKYVLDELKATRDHIDDIIKVIESRMKKDALIEQVLNTDYIDEEEKDKTPSLDIDTIIKSIAIQNALGRSPYRNTTRTGYPWQVWY